MTTHRKAPSPQTNEISTLGSEGGVLCLGLFRTGTYSLTKALNTLGYARVLHAMDLRAGLAGDNAVTQPWSRAAWANLPFMHRVLYPSPEKKPPAWLGRRYVSDTEPFSRNEWDELCELGGYHGITDLGSLYAPGLIKAYPKARVILCYRDFDKWAASVDDTLVSTMDGWAGTLVRRWAEPLAGSFPFTQLWDVLRAWFEVETAPEMRAVYRKRYERHYRTVRELVPPGQLLEYRLGDGWVPLCEFLGRPVPDEPFPRVNEGKSLRVLLRVAMVMTVLRALWAVFRYPVMVVAMWLLANTGYYVWRSYGW